ncbi:hypothetical protein P4159_02730 [Bacillus thuringiensis]|uniref:hypothetical protein n=1 Tax=Bacillus thuringiensis TaxID=1428 RepID=UPI0007C18FF8|nr:hypothetical protein [Bacillus thuringiensis]AND10772.1 hypothetical protein Bt4C1_27310 [Bacillus thuringiensis serovar alesti]MEC3594159.1 hypothetical protein [Bacillus thuringiensis]MED1834859.1 hypothetical protein [Bacillus thuringiensis]MED2210930.1 hypothetical protein [Bacillus thuringiensis]MED2669646.1 hypothetical protein [Bacillus thuringiensis]
MSFWKAVGKAALGAAESMAKEAQKREDRVNNTQARVANKSDREVVEKFKHSSGLEKMAYARELEDRGYLEKNGDGKYQRTNKHL